MATAVACEEPSHMECTVCHEHFTLPKLLPCGHLLCRHCLVTWLKSQPEANCPLCRYTIVDSKERKGRSLKDIADGFPTDMTMATLVEADRLLSKQHVCCVCVNVAAVSMCLNCGDMLCSSCATAHGKLSATKHHKVEDLASMTVEKLASNCPAFCAVHDDRMSEVYCPTHGASICLLCATTTHRQCPEVTTMETRMEEARAMLSELAATLSAGETELERAIGQLDQHLQDIDKCMQAAIAEIETTGHRLESAVKAWRQRLKELAISMSADVKSMVHDGKTLLLQRRGRLTSHKHVTKRVQGFSTHGSFGDMAAVMKTRVHDLDCSSTLPTGVKVFSTVTLTIDPQAVSRLEQELSRLGQLRVTSVRDAFQKKACLRFHDNCGKKIKLSNNFRTAQRTSLGKGNGMVMSPDPMLTDMLYQVCVDETKVSDLLSYTQLGVVTASPDTFTLLTDSCTLHPAVLCVYSGGVYRFGQGDGIKCPALSRKRVQVGSRLGLVVDTDRSLHLYADGKDQGVVARHIPNPCYFMFDLFNYCTKVTALPVTPVG